MISKPQRKKHRRKSLNLNKANLRDFIAATGLVIFLKLDSNRRFFSPCDIEILWMTPKNNRTPLLCYFKLFASFYSHWWIQTGVTVRKQCELEIWRITFKNNRAPLLCYFKLCAAFRSHWWIQTGVTVRKRPIWVKIDGFLAVWPWNLTDDLEKQKGTSPKHYQAICIISSSYVISNWSYRPETVKLGCDLCDLDLWPLTLTVCMDVTSFTGNNSWKFHDGTMMET